MPSPPFEDYPDLAIDDSEASKRFYLTKAIDPFPEILPSLLNSADIYDYVRMTGMLHPFDADPQKLKSASYEAPIEGRCIVWDQKGERHDSILKRGSNEKLVLKANSIALVQVEPYFRLPDYIALRFNLKIKHVHRGILLGTGPLIDPGFVGSLLIPLHNLTTNDYTFDCGEGLIWIEFTKTSSLPSNTNVSFPLRRRGTYHHFPEDKQGKNPDWYIAKATDHKPIRSSIPDALRQGLDTAERAEKQAKQAEQRANKAEEYVKLLSVGGGIILLLTLGTLALQTWGLIGDAWKAVSDVQQLVQSSKQGDQNQRFELLQKQLELMDSRLKDKIAILEERTKNIEVNTTQSSARSAKKLGAKSE